MDRAGCAESEGSCGFGIDRKLLSFSLKELSCPLFAFTGLYRVNQWPGKEAAHKGWWGSEGEMHSERLALSWVLGNSSMRNSAQGQGPEEDFLKCSILVQSPEATEPTSESIMAEEVPSVACGTPRWAEKSSSLSKQSLRSKDSFSFKEQPQRKVTEEGKPKGVDYVLDRPWWSHFGWLSHSLPHPNTFCLL